MDTLGTEISSEVEIEPRDVSFDVTDKHVSKYWFNNDPWTTHWFNALFSIVPIGERFICKTFASQLKDIKDPSVHKAALGLIRQERLHAREHEVMNQTLAEYGIPVDQAEAVLGKVLDLFSEFMGDETKLGFAAISEHFTASLSEVMFEHLELWDDADDEVASLMYWHFVEETEHKSVAFDVLNDRRNGRNGLSTYALRMATSAISISLFMPLIHATWLYFVWKDGQLTNIKSARRAIKTLGLSPAIVPKMFILKGFNYLKPGFHPWDIDNRANIEEWKKIYSASGDTHKALHALREWHEKNGMYKSQRNGVAA